MEGNGKEWNGIIIRELNGIEWNGMYLSKGKEWEKMELNGKEWKWIDVSNLIWEQNWGNGMESFYDNITIRPLF